jgi:acetyl-CoA carboxylase biotin carboxyl carrier protein
MVFAVEGLGLAADDNNTPRPFDVQTIRVLVGLMTRHDLGEIDLHEGDRRIRLRRRLEPAVVTGEPMTAAPLPHAPAPAAAATPPLAAPEPPAKKLIEIKSPTPGTFYAARSPGEKPYVTPGSRVTPTTVVCQVEAMKLFTEIQAECSGVIVAVLVDNAQPVEYGTVLMTVDPTQ